MSTKKAEPVPSIIVQLQVSFDAERDRGQAGRVALEWFQGGWAHLGGELRAALHGGMTGGESSTQQLFPLGAAAGMVLDEPVEYPTGTSREMIYDDAAWAEFLAELPALPYAYFEAFVKVPEIAPGGGSMVGTRYETPYYLQMVMDRFPGPDGDLVALTLTARCELLYGTAEREAAVLRFFRSAAEAYDLDYGEIGFGHGGQGTSVESVLGIVGSDSLERARDVLRGYSWVTVVPDEIAARLGGVQALSECGVFREVTLLPSGGVWLRATERFDDYDQKAAEAVFAVLAPALPRRTIASSFRHESDVYSP